MVSILITSAPRSARICVAANRLEITTHRIPPYPNCVKARSVKTNFKFPMPNDGAAQRALRAAFDDVE